MTLDWVDAMVEEGIDAFLEKGAAGGADAEDEQKRILAERLKARFLTELSIFCNRACDTLRPVIRAELERMEREYV